MHSLLFLDIRPSARPHRSTAPPDQRMITPGCGACGEATERFDALLPVPGHQVVRQSKRVHRSPGDANRPDLLLADLAARGGEGEELPHLCPEPGAIRPDPSRQENARFTGQYMPPLRRP